MNPLVLPLLLLGGAAVVFASSSKPATASGGSGGGDGGTPPTDKNLTSDELKKRIAAGQAARRLSASTNNDCGNALSALPPALLDRLVKSGTGAEDMLMLGDEAAKLGLGKAAACIWTSAARERIDLLASTACDQRLLALPAGVLKETARRIRDAADPDDLQVIATSLQNQGYPDAATCLRERASAIAPRVAEAQRITGHKLSSSVVCDVRLFELPDDQFKKILLAVDKASSADLLALADGLAALGYKAAAACIRERAKAFVTTGSGGDDRGRGPADTREKETSSPFDIAPGSLKRRVFFKEGDVASSLGLTKFGADDFDKKVAGISDEELRRDTVAILRSLDTFKTNPMGIRYTIKELQERAAQVRDEAPEAASYLDDAAKLLTIVRYWPDFAPPHRFFEQVSDVLVGLRMVGTGIIETTNRFSGWERRNEIKQLITDMENAGLFIPVSLRTLNHVASALDVPEDIRFGAPLAARNRTNVEF
jgi:hypothetical protein